MSFVPQAVMARRKADGGDGVGGKVNDVDGSGRSGGNEKGDGDGDEAKGGGGVSQRTMLEEEAAFERDILNVRVGEGEEEEADK